MPLAIPTPSLVQDTDAFGSVSICFPRPPPAAEEDGAPSRRAPRKMELPTAEEDGAPRCAPLRRGGRSSPPPTSRSRSCPAPRARSGNARSSPPSSSPPRTLVPGQAGARRLAVLTTRGGVWCRAEQGRKEEGNEGNEE
ncbi:hypothetical protein GQ55_7G320500 [Panicum hallii var. hallii]|uniref:Uncharacterized protein n=1 Tax=Panicum hallii var. hallii TaxID=1504633 RepID=A0A2T7D1F1_9POAL|nr:hypothetical protein GQ55_7G320500 [Panicum hallii var. hallii]